MVVTQPMPSMPVFFWNDPDGSKYRSSYFETYPGVWRHGDWLQITERDTLVILGRSDATLNRQGVRIGTAEIYRAWTKFRKSATALIINLERADGSDWMPLFVLLTGRCARRRPEKPHQKALRSGYSPRHVPDDIHGSTRYSVHHFGKKDGNPGEKDTATQAAGQGLQPRLHAQPGGDGVFHRAGRQTGKRVLNRAPAFAATLSV
jgi:acetoacetyl-CoA synthetase